MNTTKCPKGENREVRADFREDRLFLRYRAFEEDFCVWNGIFKIPLVLVNKVAKNERPKKRVAH